MSALNGWNVFGSGIANLLFRMEMFIGDGKHILKPCLCRKTEDQVKDLCEFPPVFVIKRWILITDSVGMKVTVPAGRKVVAVDRRISPHFPNCSSSVSFRAPRHTVVAELARRSLPFEGVRGRQYSLSFISYSPRQWKNPVVSGFEWSEFQEWKRHVTFNLIEISCIWEFECAFSK
jgi:hypothetical protein